METIEQKPILRMSPAINELFAALAKAQGEMSHAHKSADNPFFKSKYADLAECINAARDPLSKNGLCVIQGPSLHDGYVDLAMILGHSSGQWIECDMSALAKDSGPQSLGSVTTYLRRYTYCAMVGLAAEDDDGNAGQGLADKQTANGKAKQTPAKSKDKTPTPPLRTANDPQGASSGYSQAMSKIVNFHGSPDDWAIFKGKVFDWLTKAEGDGEVTTEQAQKITQAIGRREDQFQEQSESAVA